MPTQEWYDGFYADHFWKVKTDRDEPRLLREQWTKEVSRANGLISLAEKHVLDGQGAVLEIGCAYGLIARSLADKLGMVPLGVEPSASARAFATRHVGINIVASSAAALEKWTPQDPVRLIVVPNVLENTVSPNGTLRVLASILAPEGVMIIETPNPLVVMGISLFHPYLFSAEALARMLEGAGLGVLEYRAEANHQWFVVHKTATPTGSTQPSTRMFPMRRMVGLIARRWRKKRGVKPSYMITDRDRNLLDQIEASLGNSRRYPRRV